MINYSVLTYIIGDYEVLREIDFDIKETPHVEYICVTDNPNLKSDTWKIIYDETLINDNLSQWDKVFSIRYNLFKYCSYDICLRLDGSLKILKPLDELIKHFDEGNYDGCFLLHPIRKWVIDELYAWSLYKNYPPIEAMAQIRFMTKVFQYDFNVKGLIQQTISINRRSHLTNNIDRRMLRYLKVFNNHLCRLDQTMFTAFIMTEHNDKNWMFIDERIMDGRYLQKFEHGSLTQKLNIISPSTFVIPYFNDKKVKTYVMP